MFDREAVRWGSAAWLALRLITLIAALSMGLLEPGPNLPAPGYQPPELSGVAERVAGPWLRADALWYLKVSEQGYAQDGTLAFFPAFPLLTRGVSALLGNEAIAGLLVANLAAWLGLVLLFAFVRKLVDPETARTAVFGVALFPTAFFLVAPYGEPVLLAAGSAALLLALDGRHLPAAAAGVLAALSRPFGAAIALPLAALVWRQKGARRWIAPAGPIAGLAAWGVYAWQLTGSPSALVDIQGSWQRELTPFWTTLRAGFTAWRQWASTELGPYFLFDLAATLFALALIPMTVAVVRRRTPNSEPAGSGLAAYGLVALAVPLSFPFLPRPMLSNPRFVLALFPLFLGLILLPRPLRLGLAVASSAGLFLGTLVYLNGRPLF